MTSLEEIKTYKDLVASIEADYADDPRVRFLLLMTAKAAYVMGQKGL